MPIEFNQQYNSRKQQEEAPPEEDLGILDYAADMGRGVVGGALDAAESIVQLPNIFSDEETERIMPELETKTALGDITNIQNDFYDEIIEKSEKAREETRILYVAMTRAIRSFSWIEIQGKQNLSWQNLIETEV